MNIERIKEKITEKTTERPAERIAEEKEDADELFEHAVEVAEKLGHLNNDKLCSRGT